MKKNNKYLKITSQSCKYFRHNLAISLSWSQTQTHILKNSRQYNMNSNLFIVGVESWMNVPANDFQHLFFTSNQFPMCERSD